MIRESIIRYNIFVKQHYGFIHVNLLFIFSHASRSRTMQSYRSLKVYDSDSEETLKDTVQEALDQIEEKQYAAQLVNQGIPRAHIRSYGFAFHGKNVLIG